MISVVHVITKLELGGAQENTLYTCEHLDRSKFNVSLIYGPGGMLDDEARALPDTHITELGALVRQINPRQDAACFAELEELFRSLLAEHRGRGLDPDAFVVHTHSSKAGIVGRLAAKRAGVPIVVHTIHGFGFHEGQDILKKHLFINAERVAAKVTDAFVGVSRASLAEAQARRIIGPEHVVRLIRSGMDLTEFRRAERRRGEIRRALGLDEDAEAILTVANFKPQKDPLTLIDAMREVVRVRPRAVLLFAGDGELRARVESALRIHQLEDHVRLLGWRRDIADLLAACDVVVLSSIFEGLPRVAVQALAARRPFVGTRVDGTAEIIRDGRNGFLVEPRSPKKLARAIARALVSRPIDPADEVRVREWDADKMVRDQEELYRELWERRRRAVVGSGRSQSLSEN